MRITPPPKNDRTIVATARGEGPTGGEVVTYDPPGGRGEGTTAGRGRGRAASSASAVVSFLGPADGPRPRFAELERRLIDVDASIRHANGIMGRGRGTRRPPPRWTGSSRTRGGGRRGRRTTRP